MKSGTIDIKPMTPYTIAIDIEVSVICLSTDKKALLTLSVSVTQLLICVVLFLIGYHSDWYGQW